jgi:hypothetical protein
MEQLEDFLRNNKPVVKDDPTFLLKTRQRMEAVEGIKAEVDRQRSHGCKALIVALVVGLAIGAAATAMAYLYPVDANSVSEGLLDSVRAFLTTWKQYLVFIVAALAITLGIVLTRGSKNPIRL